MTTKYSSDEQYENKSLTALRKDSMERSELHKTCTGYLILMNYVVHINEINNRDMFLLKNIIRIVLYNYNH
jgi:hypothetical protein